MASSSSGGIPAGSGSLARMEDKVSRLRQELAAAGASIATGPGARGGRTGVSVGLADEDALRAQVKQLQNDLDRRQAAYIRREREYRAKVELLEHQLAKSRASRVETDTEDPMNKAREIHKNIMSRIDQVQNQTGRILEEQERDLLRAFRARLFDVQTELESIKTRNEDKAATWIEKTQQLEKELDWAKEMADRLDRHNQSLARENSRLKTQFKTQEDDREYLIRQLLAAKKDNARLRQEASRLKADFDQLQKDTDERANSLLSTTLPLTVGRPRTPGTATGKTTLTKPSLPVVGEERYREVIVRLKKLLETERKNLKLVRSQYANELQQRTELEVFLRQCIEDVRQDIARKRVDVLARSTVGSASLTGGSADGGGGGGPGLEEFSAEERERVMELLLSQERVVNLLYARTFPAAAAGSPSGAGGHVATPPAS